MEIKITEKKLNIKVEYVCIYLDILSEREDNDQYVRRNEQWANRLLANSNLFKRHSRTAVFWGNKFPHWMSNILTVIIIISAELHNVDVKRLCRDDKAPRKEGEENFFINFLSNIDTHAAGVVTKSKMPIYINFHVPLC